MYSLLIDTHDKNVVLVLYKDEKCIDKIVVESKKGHSEVTMPNFIELLKRNNVDIKSISRIFSVVGPGSFTGVRIGVVISKTIAYLLNIPIITVTSLDLKVYSSDIIKSGYYIENEKNGVFLANYDNEGTIIGEIKYRSNKEFEEIEDCLKINYITSINYDNVYKHVKNIPACNPHLVNPIYVKKIEVEK